MAFRLRRSEQVPEGIRRITRETLDDAHRQLARTGDERHAGIHEARKHLKEARAVLRLVRPELGRHFAAENHRLRDIARALSPARDARVALDTWDRLALADPSGMAEDSHVRDRLERRLLDMTDAALDDSGTLECLRDDLASARDSVDGWPLQARGFGTLRQGLRESYRRGRRKRRTALTSGRDEDFHEWRKRVKDLWYQTRLLQGVWPPVMKAGIGQLKRLSDWLGDDHDLTLLRSLLQHEREPRGQRPAAARWPDWINKRQLALRKRASRLGARVYAEKPLAYVTRIEAYWMLWRERDIA